MCITGEGTGQAQVEGANQCIIATVLSSLHTRKSGEGCAFGTGCSPPASASGGRACSVCAGRVIHETAYCRHIIGYEGWMAEFAALDVRVENS